jgi:5-methylthioadenosine/S-adenosylhomocysteine deaminase
MLAAGVNVCLGTDSLACNSSLSILDEVRFLQRAAPDCPPRHLLEMATINGMRALGLDSDLGTLTVNKLADWVALPLDGPHEDPMDAVTRGDAQVCGVWIRGNRTA